MTYGLSSSNHLCSVLSIHRWWEVGRFRIPSTTSRPALWRWLAWAPLGRGTWNADGRRLVAILVVEMMKSHGESHRNYIKLLTIHWFQNQKWTCWIPSIWTGWIYGFYMILLLKMVMFPETNCGQRCRKSWCGVIALYDWGLRFVVLRSPQWILSTAWPSECISESWGNMVIHIFYHFLIWLLYLLYFVMIYSVFIQLLHTHFGSFDSCATFFEAFFASLRSLRSSGLARCATVSSSHVFYFTSTPGNTLCCVTWCWILWVIWGMWRKP